MPTMLSIEGSSDIEEQWLVQSLIMQRERGWNRRTYYVARERIY